MAGAVPLLRPANDAQRSVRNPPSSDPQVTAVDASKDAAAWAMYNAARTGTRTRVRVLVGSWYDPVSELAGSVAGIVSNPPYIRRSELGGLQPEVCLSTRGPVLSSHTHQDKHIRCVWWMQASLWARQGKLAWSAALLRGAHGRRTRARSPGVPQVRGHEPCSALDGGDEHGTVSLDHICAGAVSMLRPGGFLALETAGGSQAHAVAGLLAALKSPPVEGTSASAGLSLVSNREHLRRVDDRTPSAAFERIEVVRDMFGVGRFVTAWRT